MAENNSGSSRREFVTTLGVVAAATVVLPQLAGTERKAAAADAAEEWMATIKPADLESGDFKAYPDANDKDRGFILARKENTIYALSSKCTHKGCVVKPGPAAKKDILLCPCHKGEYDFQGNATKEPPKLPLARHAVRLNKDGVLEVNVASLVGQDAGSIEIK